MASWRHQLSFSFGAKISTAEERSDYPRKDYPQDQAVNMLKITLILSTLVALASARPGYLHGHPGHFEYPVLHHEPLHVAKIVHVPAAISHQSSTVIHSVLHHIVKPIVVPVVKTVVHPVIQTYHPAPIIKAYHPAPPLHLDPYHHHHYYDHHLH